MTVLAGLTCQHVGLEETSHQPALPGHATLKLAKLVTRHTKPKLVPEKNIKLEKAAIFLGYQSLLEVNLIRKGIKR